MYSFVLKHTLLNICIRFGIEMIDVNITNAAYRRGGGRLVFECSECRRQACCRPIPVDIELRSWAQRIAACSYPMRVEDVTVDVRRWAGPFAILIPPAGRN